MQPQPTKDFCFPLFEATSPSGSLGVTVGHRGSFQKATASHRGSPGLASVYRFAEAYTLQTLRPPRHSSDVQHTL